MINKVHQQIITDCEFFKELKIEITSIYKNDPLEKCFLAKDVISKKKYKVRIARKEFPTNVVSEYKAISFLENSGLNWIPEIYYSNMQADRSILVYEFFEGESIDKLIGKLGKDELNAIKERLIVLINELQSIRVNGFGDFAGNSFSSWTGYFKLKLFNHVDNAREIELINVHEYEIIQDAFNENIDYYNSVNSSFLHFDIKPANIVYNISKKETNLVDFELCRMGDKLMEYVRFITSYGEPDYLHYELFIPLAKEFLGSNLDILNKSTIFILYDLYNLLAYYTTSHIKHGIKRAYLIEPIQKSIVLLKKLKDKGS